jgi:hypothetical protein
MSVIFDPALLALVAVVGGTIWFAAAARGRGAGALAAVGTVTFFVGALIGLLGAAHTVAVIGRALRQPVFEYHFRLYSLVLLGACQIAGGFRCLSTSWSLSRGDAEAWKTALGVSTLLLMVNAPLVPIQGFATGFCALLVVTLVTLIATRRQFAPTVGPRTVTTAPIPRAPAPVAT